MLNSLQINQQRLLSRIERLGQIGALPGGGCCRLALTKEDRDARELLIGWMHDLGLEVSIDAIGNIFGSRRGTDSGLPVMTGSHIDTVRTGGLYDGSLGVLGGLEAIESLNEANVVTRRPLCVACFTNEEGARFAPDMMGSLVYVGGMSLEEARATDGIDGELFGDCLDNIQASGDQPIGKSDVHAFVELHIEQGPTLEEKGMEIGVVEKVQGISWQEFSFMGTSNHAGTTPMRLRQDAGYAAMATSAFVRQLVETIGGDQVGTVGRLEIQPNLVNVVPNKTQFTVDLRNTDSKRLTQAEEELAAFVEKTAQSEGVSFSHRSLARFEPVTFNPEIVDVIEHCADALGYSHMRMPSGAGHDAQMLARVCPTAMIFVPSAGGISHNVEEYTAPEQLYAGVEVLLHTLLELAE